MEKAYIIAAESSIDSKCSFDNTELIELFFKKNNIPATHFYIDSLKAGWYSKPLKNHFRSGCAPLEAVHEALKQILNKTAEVVIISGEDNLKSSYSRESRQKLMAIYGDSFSIADLYNKVAETFIQEHQISKDDFKRIAGKLFENYKRTYLRKNGDCNPDAKWFDYITDLFRGVDCANPVIDFKGKLIVCNKKMAIECGIEERNLIEIAGTGISSTEDGPNNIHKIAEYAHLVEAYQTACEVAGIDIGAEFLNKNVLLEVYTCYPVVPLAFLLKTGIAKSYKQIPDLLNQYEITITGGMNLCKAPWNNPSLNALIQMYKNLQNGIFQYGAVHGNGGLGYKQGLVILKV